MLVGPSKCLKQIIEIKHNRVKNPNWPEANQLAIYKHGRGFELGTTVNKSSPAVRRRDLNFGASEFQVQRSDRSVRLPPPLTDVSIKQTHLLFCMKGLTLVAVFC